MADGDQMEFKATSFPVRASIPAKSIPESHEAELEIVTQIFRPSFP